MTILNTFLVVLVYGISYLQVDGASYSANSYPPDVIEDGELNTVQLIRKYKYPAEIHFVTTKDNYILQLHRIPNAGGKPILLQHGLFDSSAGYILMGPNLSLGYFLYDHGYDVWMGNARGNRYSRNHTTLSPDNDETFWNFSWHEIGIYDIPAMIDFILKVTNSKKLYYVGHSQGTTSLFVMCSMRPEYNDKIILAHALAPVAFMQHMQSAVLVYGKSLLKLPNKQSKGEVAPNSNRYRNMCLGSRQMEDVCLNIFFMLMGRDMEQLNRTRLPTVFGHIPAGAASKQVEHYNQLIASAKFRQFDYEERNQEMYNQNAPPDYDLSKVTAPIVLHYGLNDHLSAVVDVVKLSKLLPNKVEVNQIKLPHWNHIDFIYAIDVRKILYVHIEELNQKFPGN